MPYQRMRELWDADRPALGGWVVSGSEFALGVFRRAGFDYVGIDCQHSVSSEATAAEWLARTPPGTVPTIVRVSKNDTAYIGRLADAGADGIIVPMVNTPEDAAAAVGAVRYPPGGARSFGPIGVGLPVSDLDALAARVAVFVMIETAEALDNVAAIAAVPGLAGIYVGPADLSIALGMNPMRAFSSDQLIEPFERIRAACEASNIVLGLHTLNASGARQWIERGARMVTLGSDTGMLLSAASNELGAARTVGDETSHSVESSATPYGR